MMDEAIGSLQVAEQAVAALFEDLEPDERRDDQQLRLEHGRVPASLIPVAATLSGQFQAMAQDLARMEALLEEALEDEFAALDKATIETWHINLGGLLGRAEGALGLWQEYAVTGEGEVPPKALDHPAQQQRPVRFDLRCSPILAADILQEYLWSRAAGVIVTSATITALIPSSASSCMGAPREANYKIVASPSTTPTRCSAYRPWIAIRAMPRPTPGR